MLIDLSDLLHAGIDLAFALQCMSAQKSKQATQAVVLRTCVLAGRPLSDGLVDLGFPVMVIRFTRVGEITGELAQALKRTAHFLQNRRLRKERIGKLLVYPAMLAIMSIIVVELLTAVVLPNFAHMYMALGIRLSSGVAALFWLGAGIAWALPRTFLTLSVLLTGLLTMRKKWTADRLPKWIRAGVLWRVVQAVKAKQSMEVLAFLLGGGVDILLALQVMADIDVAGMQRQWRQAADAVVHGVAVSRALSRMTQLPKLVSDLMELAEQSGDMHGCAQRLTTYYERSLDQTTERAFRYVEPVATAVLGLIIGGATLLFMLPMMNLVRQMS